MYIYTYNVHCTYMVYIWEKYSETHKTMEEKKDNYKTQVVISTKTHQHKTQ